VAAQEEAIATAEAIFKYVAETYLETPTSPASTAVPRPVAKPMVKTPSFLASACTFQRPTTATTTVPILKRTPKEALADELTRYFNFEAMPSEWQEGEERSSDEPSAQEVLLNPLLWWKVSNLFIYHYPFLRYSVFRFMPLNSLPLLGWLGTILPFLQLVSLSNESSRSPDIFVAIYGAL
jgi:hypothetical protein